MATTPDHVNITITATASPTANDNKPLPSNMPKLTLSCYHCSAQFRIQNISLKTPIINQYYCPSCGHKCGAFIDIPRDYYEALAESYNTTVPLIQAAYQLWNPTEHHRFSDFMQEEMGYNQP